MLIKITRPADYAHWGRRGPVAVQVYKLEREPGFLDSSWLIFAPVATWITKRQYCEKSYAFSQIFNLKGPHADTCENWLETIALMAAGRCLLRRYATKTEPELRFSAASRMLRRRPRWLSRLFPESGWVFPAARPLPGLTEQTR